MKSKRTILNEYGRCGPMRSWLYRAGSVFSVVAAAFLMSCIHDVPVTRQIKDAVVTFYDEGYIVRRPNLEHYPPILVLQGDSYQRGKQQGVLVGAGAVEFASTYLTPVYAMAGGWQPDGQTPPTMEQILGGRTTLQLVYYTFMHITYLMQAPDVILELQGVMDGIREVGVPAGLTVGDLFVANSLPDVTEVASGLADMFSSVLGFDACSNAITWGDATSDGRLIWGGNLDYETFDTMHKNMVIQIVKPDDGHAYIGANYAGSVTPFRSMNAQGLTVGASVSHSADRDLIANQRITNRMLLRKLLLEASSIDDVRLLINTYGPGTTGYNIIVGDSKVNAARVFETSCTHMAEIRPMSGMEMIWATNHFNAYPGWQEYPLDGYNMVRDQMEEWEVPWEEVDTIEEWQAWLVENKNSGQRYQKFRELLTDQYQNLDVQTFIPMLRTYPLAELEESRQIAPPCDHLFGIHRPIILKHLRSVVSFIADPTRMMFWAAAGTEPAQDGVFWPIDFAHYLASMNDPREYDLIPDTDMDVMPDDWERAFDLDPGDPSDAEQDPDEDGATNLEEYEAGTDPTDPTE